ncbi:MAG: signal recognition particle-docking protein FtsY [Myxococcales bacterium]|nr:signal recognition particle-docking protein FtsY [Myxococcales bacterium]
MVDESTPEHTRVRVAPPEAAAPPTRDPIVKAPAKAPAAKAPAAKAPAAKAPAAKAPAAKAPAPVDEPIEAAGKTLREGLARTHDGFVKKLGKLFGSAKAIDDDLLGDLEEALFTADIGVRTSQKLVELVQEELSKKALQSPAKVWGALKDRIAEILIQGAQPLDFSRAKPFVIMVVGVNGAGKTTSIGKLAHRYAHEGKRVLLAAGDTFRAAAVEQLEVWSQRAGVPVVKGRDGQDPSSVIFEAVERAEREGYDICIADTAGRLQAKKELMDELAKIHRAIGKAVPGAPHEVWLVLDSTNGQNAISQAKVFTEVVDVSGIVLTKLDGTAKGGVVIGITDEMQIPVRYIGIGEKVEDLRPFDAKGFADALFAED